MKSRRILYLYRDSPFARFIRDDLAILRERYLVDEVRMQASARTGARLLMAAARCDLVYFWWGDVTGLVGAALARAFDKPSLMITGGYDVADVPEIEYGLRYHPWRRHLPPVVLRMASHIVANAQFSRAGVIRDYGVPSAKVSFVPHGLEASAIPLGEGRRERRVLTCSLLSRDYIPYKGLDTFVRAAASFPDVPFVHVGPDARDGAREELLALAPLNVELRGFLSEPELVREMQRSAVYAQLSAHEGFGLALAEAMLAGATPVATRVAAIPEVAGPVAEYTAYGDVEGTVAAIERALARPRPQAARERIVSTFSLERRRRGILELVEGLLGARSGATSQAAAPIEEEST